ncbi:hypothetical protein GCM10009613_51790 [Pseudonocardia kongjuensis]|uniref:Uncharacterized protein n=1 Tax=Pseudonocardia kongjuensis TaxID=102227 RepID=A0ABP4ISQ8_9PSEU
MFRGAVFGVRRSAGLCRVSGVPPGRSVSGRRSAEPRLVAGVPRNAVPERGAVAGYPGRRDVRHPVARPSSGNLGLSHRTDPGAPAPDPTPAPCARPTDPARVPRNAAAGSRSGTSHSP